MSTSQNGCGCYWQSQPFFIKSGVIDVIKSEKAKMLAGELFNVYDPELVSERAAARQQVEAFNQLGETDPQQSRTLIKQLFGATGEKVEVHATFRCDYGYNLYVGEDFFANYDCAILDVAPIHIGKHCLLGPKVQIYSVNHPDDPKLRRNGAMGIGKPVTLGDDLWVGGGAIICPGVTLGNNVIVAAGSVVTKSFGDNVVIGGNPARVIRELPKN
jgi:maltose O-acetyltransferase